MLLMTRHDMYDMGKVNQGVFYQWIVHGKDSHNSGYLDSCRHLQYPFSYGAFPELLLRRLQIVTSVPNCRAEDRICSCALV
jgi:hypothetical protein